MSQPQTVSFYKNLSLKVKILSGLIISLIPLILIIGFTNNSVKSNNLENNKQIINLIAKNSIEKIIHTETGSDVNTMFKPFFKEMLAELNLIGYKDIKAVIINKKSKTIESSINSNNNNLKLTNEIKSWLNSKNQNVIKKFNINQNYYYSVFSEITLNKAALKQPDINPENSIPKIENIKDSKINSIKPEILNYQIMLMVSENDISSKISGVLSLSVLLGFLGAIIIVLIGIVLSNLISKPLVFTTKKINDLAAGSLDIEHLPEQGEDEIGLLVKSYNKLIDGVAQLATRADEIATGIIDIEKVQKREEQKKKEAEKTKKSAEEDTEQQTNNKENESTDSETDIDNTMDSDISNSGHLAEAFDRMELVQSMLLLKSEAIAQDNLFNAALNKQVDGKLGDAFKLMTRNLRIYADQANIIAVGDLDDDDLITDGKGGLSSAFSLMIKMLKELCNDLIEIGNKNLNLDLTKSNVSGVLGDSLKKMFNNLNDIIKQFSEATIQINSTSTQLMAAAREAEQGTITQSAAVEEVRAAMESLSQTSSNIADHSGSLSNMGKETHENSKRGIEVVDNMLLEMNKIENQNKIISDKIMYVNKTTTQIEDILKLIGQIADKTDILALNAALEGTKAGESGKGFSLVAMEMRRLAENVSSSADDIKDLVKSIQDAVNSSVVATEEGIKLTLNGVQLAEETKNSFEDISGMVNQTTSGIDEIATVIVQQMSSTEQVLNSISEITEITKQTAGSNKEIASSAIELNEMATNFKKTIAEFKLKE